MGTTTNISVVNRRWPFFMHPPHFLSPDLPNLKAMLRDMILYFDF